MKKLLRAAATTASALAISAGGLSGVVAAQSGSGTIRDTGPKSTNKVINDTHSGTSVDNDNDVGALNVNVQWGHSGHTRVSGNTTGRDATSGSVRNSSTSSTNVSITNSSPSSGGNSGGSSGGNGTISNTGPKSDNIVVNKSSSYTHVDNDNDVHVGNLNFQGGHSGSARVSGNTTGGDATSGDVSNTSSTTTTINIKN